MGGAYCLSFKLEASPSGVCCLQYTNSLPNKFISHFVSLSYDGLCMVFDLNLLSGNAGSFIALSMWS